MSTVKTQPALAMSLSGFQALISRCNLARWAPIPLRLIVGYGFFAHGVTQAAAARTRNCANGRGVAPPIRNRAYFD